MITQKILEQFSQNSVERWHMGHGRNYIRMEIWIVLHQVSGSRLRGANSHPMTLGMLYLASV